MAQTLEGRDFGDKTFGRIISISNGFKQGVVVPRLAPRAADALDVHSTCRRYFQDPEKMRRFWSALEGGQVPGDGQFLARAPRAIMACVDVAQTFWCSPPICDLLTQTSSTLPLDWTLRPEHAITEDGFLVFGQPKPLPLRPEDDWLAFAGMVWWQVKPQPNSHEIGGLFCSILNWAGVAPSSHGGGVTPVMPMSTIYWPFGTSLGVTIDHSKTVVDDQEDGVYKPGTGEAVGEELKDRERRTVEFEWRMLATIFAFMEQRILVPQRELVDRAARKRLEKTGWDHEPAVNVVTLRRVHRDGSSAGEGEPHDWQYQWTVRGHWRSQYYPSTSSHKTIWVMPYVKGPEGKPLKPPKPTLFSVSR